jgi:Na+/proline symporter
MRSGVLLILLLGAWMLSFVSAESYSSSASVAFTANSPEQVIEEKNYEDVFQKISEYVVVILVVVAFFMAYRIKKRQKTKDKKVVSKKKSKKKKK